MVFFTRGNPTLTTSAVPSVRMKIERPRLGIQTASVNAVQAGSASVQGDSFESALRAEEVKKAGQSTERWAEYTIQENDTLWKLAVKRFHVNPEDLIRDNGIEDPRKIQPGRKIRVRLPSYPERTDVVASWYGREHHGRPMANGEKYNMNAATIAHKDLPLGTRVELENPLTSERVRAVVADRGPYVKGRDVDLSYGLARKLSLVEKGVGPLVMRVLG
jgi:rare lipoprotein A